MTIKNKGIEEEVNEDNIENEEEFGDKEDLIVYDEAIFDENIDDIDFDQ
jgi:hypothetical protein